MDPHLLPLFNDGRFDVRPSPYRTNPIILSGTKVEHASSFSPPSEYDYMEMSQARKSQVEDSEASSNVPESSRSRRESNKDKKAAAPGESSPREVWTAVTCDRVRGPDVGEV